MESVIDNSQLRWTGHVVSMPDYCLLKLVVFTHLNGGSSNCGHQWMRCKGTLKRNLNKFVVDINS